MRKVKWIVLLADGREITSDSCDPWEVPLDSPVALIAQPGAVLAEGDYLTDPVLVAGNYTHFVFRDDLQVWMGHERDSDVVRALSYYARHISALRSAVQLPNPDFAALYARGRSIIGMK